MNWVDKLDVSERVSRARDMAPRIVDHVAELVALHEANRIIVYSPTLAAQIPESYAAHAFNVFQRTMHSFELVRLCALWDRSASNRDSIPTLVSLIRKPDVLARLGADISTSWGVDSVWGQSQARKLVSRACRAIALAEATASSNRLRSLVNHRDKYLAHALPQSLAETKGGVFARPRYGDERRLLRRSVRLADAFYLATCNTSFDFDHNQSLARKYSEALWNGCRFEVLT